MSELALCILIALSAMGGAVIGIIVYIIMEAENADRKNSAALHAYVAGRSGSDQSKSEGVLGWESYGVLPREAEQRALDTVVGAGRN